MELRLILLLVIFLQLAIGQEEPDNACIKCLCHARTGCYFLTNCASYSISQSYWEIGGQNVPARSHSLRGYDAYMSCKRDEECIRSTIRGYMRAAAKQDCNNDGIVDCKDFASIHYEGPENCDNELFNPYYLRRLDTCLAREMGDRAPDAGWKIHDVAPQ